MGDAIASSFGHHRCSGVQWAVLLAPSSSSVCEPAELALMVLMSNSSFFFSCSAFSLATTDAAHMATLLGGSGAFENGPLRFQAVYLGVKQP